MVPVHLADPEELIVHILEMLRIFKYQPRSSINPYVQPFADFCFKFNLKFIIIIRSEFRQNILVGERDTYTHLFQFLFEKMPELQKRAYLAKYLVKIEVSPDFEGDNDIVELYTQVN